MAQSVLAALPAGRRLGQLRVARRRQRRGDALHRMPARAHQRRDAHGDRAGDGARSARTTTARRPSRSSCRRASRTCWSTARPASPSAWRRTSRRTTSNEVCTALVKLLDNEDISNAQLCRYVKGPDFPTGGQILNSPDELKEIYRTGSGSIRLRGTWDIGPETRSTKTIYIDEHSVHREQVAARRAHRRRRAQPQAAAAARREGPLDRGRAHRARDEEGRRREDGDGVSLQAHAAADQLRRQPDVPRAGRENPEVGRPERLDLQADALALPPLPPRGRHQAARARAGGAARSGSTSSRASRRSSTRSTRSSGSSASRTARRTPPRRS